ncbi:antibiotic biosynthesis monooxygenase family protein [Flagellimonas nanhaiensis]|nr:hypothetical protein [Allomuricauda nanhaiensis]
MENVETNQVYEIAIYQIKDEVHEFKRIHSGALDHLSSYQGFIDSKSYENINNPNMYMDMVLWESIEQAKNAQEKFEQGSTQVVGEFLSSMNAPIFFDHVKVLENGNLKFREVEENGILEFASFHINSGALEQFNKDRMNMMNYIGENYSNFKQVKTVQSIADKTLIIDIAHWGSATECHKAQQELEQHELFLQFASSFDPNKEMMMEFFKQIR